MKAFAIGLFLFLIGCAPAHFEPFRPPPIAFEKTPLYVFDSSQLSKPDKPQQILLDDNFRPVEESSKAKYVAFVPSEFAKIVALNRLFNSQQEIITKQVELVNVNIEIINGLKQLVALKEAELNEYISLWANSENALRQERAEHQRDNLINRGLMYIITIGSIILLAIGF